MQRETAKSMSFSLGDGPANALCLSKDNTHVVVAGRNVFKILAIEEDSFVEKQNLRVGKNLNLNYSCNDVTWSTIDENLIATGATNGAVVLWNLSKASRAKQEHVFVDHLRTVHKVVFHPTDPCILLSGSQDGTVKCFDLRHKEATITYKTNSESVRDVQFIPKSNNNFTSVSENGAVQLWDVRKGDRPFLAFTAHSGPVFSCDWHPELPYVLATGGRDRGIKVWTISNYSVGTLDHTIQTVASVGRVKWRPQRKNHIGSTSLVVDASVCVWDVRRPFVPFAAFEKHKDVATGIAWKGSPHVFISTSKDCTVWQNIFRDASRPASKAIPQALALNIRTGEVAQALSTQQQLDDYCTVNVQTVPAPPPSTNSTSGSGGGSGGGTTRFQVFKKSSSPDEQFHLAKSLFYTFEAEKVLRHSFHVDCASRYIVWGKSVTEMCDNNAKVALSLNIDRVAMTWELAKLYYLTISTEAQNTNRPHPLHRHHLHPSKIASIESQVTPSNHHLHHHHHHHHPSSAKENEERTEHNDSNNSDNDDVNNNSSSETEKQQDFLSKIASGLQMNHSIFLPQGNTYDFQVQQDYQILPAEAFQLRHEIREGSSPPIHLEDCSPRDTEENVETVAIENRTSQLTIAEMEPVPFINLVDAIVDALFYHAKQGDVQTAVCVWLVLASASCYSSSTGTNIMANNTNIEKQLPIDPLILESWCWSYVELLQRHRLFAEAALIIKHCSVIGHLSQQSTSFLVCCGSCGKPINPRMGNYCEKCKRAVARCSVCHCTVTGLVSWCQGCNHGGHFSHLKSWFSKHKECPVGCGHQCHT